MIVPTTPLRTTNKETRSDSAPLSPCLLVYDLSPCRSNGVFSGKTVSFHSPFPSPPRRRQINPRPPPRGLRRRRSWGTFAGTGGHPASADGLEQRMERNENDPCRPGIAAGGTGGPCPVGPERVPQAPPTPAAPATTTPTTAVPFTDPTITCIRASCPLTAWLFGPKQDRQEPRAGPVFLECLECRPIRGPHPGPSRAGRECPPSQRIRSPAARASFFMVYD